MKIQFTRENKKAVTKGTIGLFLEDINYGIDGGLNAEMLENPNFEAKDAFGKRDNFTVAFDGGYAWEAFPEGSAAALKVKTDRALFPENPHYMRLTASVPGVGMKNKAFDGIYLEQGMKYRVSFYARSYDYKGGALIGVYKDGAPVLIKKVKFKADGQWNRYQFTLKSKVSLDRGDFALTLLKSGTVHFDFFSMIPENAVFGVFRRDLVNLMKELQPGFLRFPGGCIVEGNTLENRYAWKNSLGVKERRKHNWNRWAVHNNDESNGFHSQYSHYGQTLGIGYFEYFRLCEYLGAKPFPVVNVGMACQFMSTEMVPVDSPEFETYIQDALDLVEFARGGVDTVWGRVRTEMGHPQPFALEYFGVGNEQWLDKVNGKSNEFHKRFEIFEQRLHEKYPDLKIIGTVGPNVGTPSYKSAWKWTRENLKKNPEFVYASDEHFYVSPEWFYQNVHIYDNYPREGKVCAGEYAANVPESGGGKINTPQANCWAGALAEAAFMTGMEQNSDVVVMASYAPLLARFGYSQWSPNLIWFDGKRSYATVNYYVQKLFSLYAGDFALPTTAEEDKKLYASAVERDGAVFVKAVNASDEEMEVEIEGDFDFGSLTRIEQLSGNLNGYNALDDSEKIAPVEVAPAAERSVILPPRSLSVLVFMK
ncbi:MAG: alpha-L-arabinofuranosidase [Clostridia bacterium]|nr:alpha-L-arabinofuranosidase [Clostridia bacterium]